MSASARAALLLGLASAAGLSALAAGALAADTWPPVVTGFAPADGGYVNGTRLYPSGLARTEVTADFSDLESALNPDNVTVAVFAEAGAAPLPADQFSTQRDPSGTVVSAFALYFLPDGRYRIELAARDDAGNAMLANSNFTVDVLPPSLTVSAPNSTNESSIHVRFDARDAGSGVSLPAVLSYKSACSWSWLTAPVEAIEVPGRVIGDATVPVCVGANNQFTLVVRDRAGNTATHTQDGIACDLSGPVYSGFQPRSFTRFNSTTFPVSVTISDDASGVNPARVELRLSFDGGVTWGNWTPAGAQVQARTVRANATVVATDGATVALVWRAWDRAGNGPTFSRTEFYYVNGPPFLESFAPEDGTLILEYDQVFLSAVADDPDADYVSVSVSSDVDGLLGRIDNGTGAGPGRLVRLSLGIHNLTVALDDGHQHVVRYVYQVQVVPRPPPDPRPLMLTGILAGVMAWFAYAAYTKDEDEALEGAAKA